MKKNKTILDVRTTTEFAGGHVSGSINIPLHELPGRLEEIKKMEPPLFLCCASGARSAQATVYLQKMGIECKNVGSWLDVNFN